MAPVVFIKSWIMLRFAWWWNTGCWDRTGDSRDGRCGHTVTQISPKWGKSRNISDQILKYFAIFWSEKHLGLFHLELFWPSLRLNLTFLSDRYRLQGCQIWHPNWVRLAPNWTNLGLFKISFPSQNVLKLILKSPRFVQFDPIWMPNLIPLNRKLIFGLVLG